MSEDDLLSILTIFLCLVGSMFFSGSETAITSFGERRAQKLLEQRGPGFRALHLWVHQPVRILSTILVGNNITNTLMGAVATALAIRHFGETDHPEYAVPVAVVVVTGLLLIFGEITPKAVGRMYAQRVTPPVLRVLGVLERLMFPLVWAATKLTDALIVGMFDEESSKASSQPITAEEIEYLVDVGEREGSIPEDTAELLRGAVRFEEKIVADIAIPESETTMVDLSWDIERIRSETIKSGHSRIPVCDGDIDRIRGVLHIKELLGRDEQEPNLVQDLLRPPMFVSDSMLIHDLLTRFKEKRVHLGIVVDDGGHTVGIVTLEDVIEEIVGEIYDETDRAPKKDVDSRGIRYVNATVSLTQIEEIYDVEFDEEAGVTSVGDLLTHLAGQVPIAGSVFVIEGLRFKVLAADDKHIIRVSIEQVDVEDVEED
jgi:CBS domain containing-hemolysin-like protein